MGGIDFALYIKGGGKMKTKKKGFTLVEMLIVITIFGVLFGIAIISLGNLGEVSSEGEAERITQVLKTWRELAISTQNQVEIIRIGNNFVLKINGVERNRRSLSKLRFGYSKATVGVTEAGGNLDVDGVAFEGDVLIVDRRGAATQGAFYLTDGERDFAIGVSSSGRIKLWRWGNGWY